MDKLIEFLGRQGGRVSVVCRPLREEQTWLVGVEFGREADDSEMAAGASYGVGATFEEAVTTVHEELGLR